MTRREWLAHASTKLQGCDAPRLSAELVLAHVLELDRLQLILSPQEEVPPAKEPLLKEYLARLRSHEPLAYILGRREFYGRDFLVNPATLIPRPESEHLIEEALARLPENGVFFADLGTGSGCLAVTLAAERPLWQGIAVDLSSEALACAQKNAVEHGVAERLEFIQADFTAPVFLSERSAGLQLLVSNPPYISEEEYHGLDANVRGFEPKSALVPGTNGLEHLRAIANHAVRLLLPGALLLMEHGAGQGEEARSLCSHPLWQGVSTGKDLAGLDRYLIAQRL